MVRVYEFKNENTSEYKHIALSVDAHKVQISTPFTLLRSFIAPKVWGGPDGKLHWNVKQES